QHAGIVHRDVTPHNVLVSTNGVAKLVDFGVAKARDNESKTETGAVKGKFAYMSPEQIEGKPPDARMDLFAVGVMLFELLTNMRPFGDDLGAIHAILSRPHPDPRDIRPEIPQSIVNILELALAKDADQRYQSAAAMAADLEEFTRASGQYASQADVALYVCDVLDIPPPVTQRHTSDGPRARITERERSIDSGDHGAPALTLPEVGPATIKTAPPKLAEPTALVNLSEHVANTTGEHNAAGGVSQGKLVAIFGAVIVGILGLALVVGYLATSRGKKPPEDPKTKVTVKDKDKDKDKGKEKPKTADPKPDWSVLMSPEGTPVILRSKVPARLFYKGVWIGKTPLTIPLAKGEYTVQIKRERGDGEGELKVKIDDSTRPLQIFEFKGF
ncbi:MAG: serine/threonine protein kinase, partial [Myxococcales bacterium]|nr:serine/threonine protein kinase [Myxococcales bacterium]